jgi:ammonium transporter
MFVLYINKMKLKADWEFSPALAIGAAADRGRMLPCIVFMFIWSTIIYDPIACWTWNPAGWTFKMGGLDFAGGTPVHISSGAAALAYSIMLGKRRGYNDVSGLPYRPHNVTHIVLGTVFLWVGWFGFNGGSALGANMRAVMACVVTHLAASVGGVTWVLLDYRLEKKWSTVGFCSGAVSGLVAITPASGFVPAWSAVIFGVVGAVCCNYATKLKYVVGIDDALDIFAEHGVGGIVGNLLTSFFAAYVFCLPSTSPHSHVNTSLIASKQRLHSPPRRLLRNPGRLAQRPLHPIRVPARRLRDRLLVLLLRHLHHPLPDESHPRLESEGRYAGGGVGSR